MQKSFVREVRQKKFPERIAVDFLMGLSAGLVSAFIVKH